MARTSKGTGEDNRKKILEAAMALIGETGVESTSLAGIARAAGVSKGTVYYYYASKSDLVFDIADLHMERITRALLGMVDQGAGRLTWESLLTAYFTTLLASDARSRLHLYLVREAAAGNEQIKQRFQATYAQWFAMMDQTWDRLTGSGPPAAAKARYLVAVVDGFILQTQIGVETPPMEEMVRLTLAVIRE